MHAVHAQDLSNLKHVLQHGLDRKGAAQLSQQLAMTCSLHANGGNSSTLVATLLLPAATLTLTPLYSKRLCDVPLAQSLAAGTGPPAQVCVLHCVACSGG